MSKFCLCNAYTLDQVCVGELGWDSHSVVTSLLGTQQIVKSGPYFALLYVVEDAECFDTWEESVAALKFCLVRADFFFLARTRNESAHSCLR